eukprot:COSAG01_NODE_1513_length_10065_cov_63.160144_4_plen_131_part_00
MPPAAAPRAEVCLLPLPLRIAGRPACGLLPTSHRSRGGRSIGMVGRSFASATLAAALGRQAQLLTHSHHRPPSSAAVGAAGGAGAVVEQVCPVWQAARLACASLHPSGMCWVHGRGGRHAVAAVPPELTR